MQSIFNKNSLISLSFLLLSVPQASLASEIFKSSNNQIGLLELYTSEGCNSCPPAERWLANIESHGFTRQRVIPLAFHVTYWDYLGWKDHYSKKQFDQRQRQMVLAEGGRTVYTPQFFLNGKTLRSVSQLGNNVPEQKTSLAIEANRKAHKDGWQVDIRLTETDPDKRILRVVLTAYANNIRSVIKHGENAGTEPTHQYVVRDMSTALVDSSQSKTRRLQLKYPGKGEKYDGMVLFVEVDGEIRQVLDMPL